MFFKCVMKLFYIYPKPILIFYSFSLVLIVRVLLVNVHIQTGNSEFPFHICVLANYN